MALIIITASHGHVAAMAARIRAIASWPRHARSAVALVLRHARRVLVQRGFSLVFGAVLAIESPGASKASTTALAPRAVGLGSIWAQGLSGIRALQMGRPARCSRRFATSSRMAAWCPRH